MTTTNRSILADAVETASTVSDKLHDGLRVGLWTGVGGLVQVQLRDKLGVVRDLTGLVKPREALAFLRGMDETLTIIGR